ncbi:MAG: DUF5069 domain-containing protein [Akkermansiaceae bacterium]
MTWNEQFDALFQKSSAQYRSGNLDFMSYYSEEDLGFLSSIGYKPRELFDFVEDFADESLPAPSTALLIAAVRRDFFLVMQGGEASSHEVTRNDIPSFGEEIDGIAYLPRIIAKAKAKLKGELHPDLMFCCGGDRKFLSDHNIHPADFLRNVWAADGDGQKVADFVKASTA